VPQIKTRAQIFARVARLVLIHLNWDSSTVEILATMPHRGEEAEDNVMRQSSETGDVSVTWQLQQTQQPQDSHGVAVRRAQAACDAVDVTTQRFCHRTPVHTGCDENDGYKPVFTEEKSNNESNILRRENMDTKERWSEDVGRIWDCGFVKCALGGKRKAHHGVDG